MGSSAATVAFVLVLIAFLAFFIYGIGALYIYIDLSRGRKPTQASWVAPILIAFYFVLFALMIGLIAAAWQSRNYNNKTNKYLEAVGYKGDNPYKALKVAAQQARPAPAAAPAAATSLLEANPFAAPGEGAAFAASAYASPARADSPYAAPTFSSPARADAPYTSPARSTPIEIKNQRIKDIIGSSGCAENVRSVIKQLYDEKLITI